ncbi:MAG: SGNH/GDSL hydrolase family protein [Planctomycetota bacterium]|nr:SGNH/GDSL hydrolase family protein [Planctomycetota bacterium]
MHVVLLGDSVFDNRPYVRPGEPDVVEQVRERLPEGSQATLLARDGDVTSDVAAQLGALPRDATHVFLSVGGNDVLGHAGMLRESASSVAQAVRLLAAVGESFEASYRSVLDIVLARGLPTGISTIYYPRFDMEETARHADLGMAETEQQARQDFQRLACTALSVFNDVIIRGAFERGLPLLDLRLICSEESDYANPIEPSAAGGAKIAGALVEALLSHDFSSGRTQVFT